ncbi:MAG: helix-turn-helix transcriptional regulator [Solirubrobacterales bacterium]|nr:helix-turn-helix transcriptional regulator [Solirubrobacterales bacterium]
MYSRKRFAGPHQRGPRHHHHHHRGGASPWRSRGGPRARRGDVRAAVLALLAERQMHGYEMIKEIEDRSGGYWKPSAGSIYPTLQLLEEQGLISGADAEGKRLFTLTADGRTTVEEGGGETAPWEQVRSGAPPESVQLGRSLKQLAAAASQAFQAADESQRVRIRELLDETRRGIYAILAEDEKTA